MNGQATKGGGPLKVVATGAVLLVAAGVLTVVLAQQCPRRVGDETDFPMFNLLRASACGTTTLFGA